MSDPDPVSLETYEREDGKVGVRVTSTKQPVTGLKSVEVENQWPGPQLTKIILNTATSQYDPAKP